MWERGCSFQTRKSCLACWVGSEQKVVPGRCKSSVRGRAQFCVTIEMRALWGLCNYHPEGSLKPSFSFKAVAALKDMHCLQTRSSSVESGPISPPALSFSREEEMGYHACLEGTDGRAEQQTDSSLASSADLISQWYLEKWLPLHEWEGKAVSNRSLGLWARWTLSQSQCSLVFPPPSPCPAQQQRLWAIMIDSTVYEAPGNLSC